MIGKLEMKGMVPHQIPDNTLVISPKGLLYLNPKLNSCVIIICISSTLENKIFTVFLSFIPVTQCTLGPRLQLRTSIPIKIIIKLEVCDLLNKYSGIF